MKGLLIHKTYVIQEDKKLLLAKLEEALQIPKHKNYQLLQKDGAFIFKLHLASTRPLGNNNGPALVLKIQEEKETLKFSVAERHPYLIPVILIVFILITGPGCIALQMWSLLPFLLLFIIGIAYWNYWQHKALLIRLEAVLKAIEVI